MTRRPNYLMLCALAAFAMAYGWGYRGTVGFELGATVPGALLGLVLVLGSGRLDWHRRAAVAGLFGAVGWAWGGSFSYMEQTLYALSDSFPDVVYGYAMLFFLGALWAGIGGGVLGLALTERRSELERLVRPFTWICVAFLSKYIYFFFARAQAEAIETLTVRQFHDGPWLAAATALAVSGLYWLLRPKDRPATALFFWGSVAWWVGYLGFTKFGGLRLAPLHRNESWGGILGVLIVLIVFLVMRKNRAALMLCLYGVLGGGFAFSFAVFLRHPLAVHWGPFQGKWPQWRFAEVSFGFLMGLAIALGAVRLLRGKLAPPEEDTPRAPLDVYAVFVILVALIWANFRRHAAPVLARSSESSAAALLGIPLWAWLAFLGVLATMPLLLFLYRYLRGDRQLAPQSPFGKGVLVALMLMWGTVAGYLHHDIMTGPHIDGLLLLWIPAAVATWLLMSYVPGAQYATVPGPPGAAPSDPKWRVGRRYWMLWGLMPLFILAIAGLSTAMQEGPLTGMGRKRFGPDAYWRQTARLMGTWRVVGQVRGLEDTNIRQDSLPLVSLEFGPNRDVTATMPGGATDSTSQWFLKNQYTWLRWRAKAAGGRQTVELPLEFRGSRLYIAGLPLQGAEGYLVFERMDE